MAVITLARQVGSGGQAIANRLGEQLGYAIVGRRDLGELARQQGLTLPEEFVDFADETPRAAPPLAQADLYLSYGELEFDEDLRGVTTTVASSVQRVSFLEQIEQDQRTVFLAVQGLVYEVAARDRVVIIGAGGQLILAEVPGVLRVKIVAPEEIRVTRLMTSHGLTPVEAQAAVHRGDQEQRDYNRAVFGVDWDDPLHWDLVINTECWEVEEASELIVAAVRQPQFQEEPTDTVLAALATAGQIDLRLHRDSSLGASLIYAVPTVDGLALRGEVTTEEQAERALALARDLAGDVAIRNDVTVRDEDGVSSDPLLVAVVPADR